MRTLCSRAVVRVRLLLLCFSFAGPAVHAGTITLTPSADAFVTAGPVTTDRSGNNYGAAGALAIAAPGSSQGEFQSVMQFDLVGAKSTFDAAYGAGNWTINVATLRLTAAAPNNPLFNASSAGSFAISFMQNDAWPEGTGTPNLPTSTGITFASLPALQSGSDAALGTFSFGGGTSGASDYALTLPAAFVADLSAGGTTSLRLAAADTSVAYLFNSRNFGTAANRPLLTISAVPEPVSIIAFALPLMLLARRRRHA